MALLHSRRSLLLLIVAVSLAGILCLDEGRPALPPPAEPPRLVVLVVFDQMRGDYPGRWQNLFGDDGFRRLQRRGAWFQNCHYPYAHTVTGAGHASLLTGCSPWKHGIVANDWYDRATGTSVYCVSSDRYGPVPPQVGYVRSESNPELVRGVSPERLLAPTLGDVLKEATHGRGRVVSLSFKDRSAVLPAGHHADACYWFDVGSGLFVTSSYYRDRLHPWVADFNRTRPADRWLGRDWDRLRTDLDYAAWSGPDDVASEGVGIFQGRTFPHPLMADLRKPNLQYYQALYNSPFGNDLLLELAERALVAEQLGRRDVPDLLCLSFSCNDPIGHCWGPDSQEVLDVTLRSDRVVAELLASLDAEVGKGRYLLALTADHGVCPLPEVAAAQGQDAGRVPPAFLAGAAEEFLEKTFARTGSPGGRWIEATSDPWIYLNQRVLRAQGLDAAEVETALAGWLKQQPGILAAYGRTQLLSGPPADDMGAQVWRSFHPERCGDVAVVVKPYYLLSGALTGTGHGTPHPYDTYVPLLAYGPGIRPGVRHQAVTPQAVAAIFAHALRINPPASAEVGVPANLFESP